MFTPGFPLFNPNDFSDFTCSRVSHFERFARAGLDREFFGSPRSPDTCSLKNYQDLLVLAFIRQFVPPGTPILEVGGGNSRIIRHLKAEYDCWNLDKLEGIGQGPVEIDTEGFHLVKDYIGGFSKELPDNHFDFVFSISALEHVPDKDPGIFPRIRDDLNRVLRPGCYSLHCFDSIIKPDRLWINQLLVYLFQHEQTLNPFIPYESLRIAPDVFALPEFLYNKRWLPLTRKPYNDFGRPISINILWRKPE